jgi:asparagine synthase (glutamine-hydrolysing)
MCGISGIAIPEQSARRLDAEAVAAMNAALAHRGPDDSGVVIVDNVALANRRLSIVDVPGGHQPMSSNNGTLTVTYNGEIYNAPDIRRALEREGHLYRTNCDTEAVLHLYAEHGKNAVRHMRGCFAFAVWDRERRELLLARDRLGVKPLYFTHATDGTLYFASEIKALLAGGAVSAELNVSMLPGLLANRATYGEQTMFAGVRRLPPGHVLTWRNGRIEITEYWDIDPIPPAGQLTDADYLAEWQHLFRESIRLRLMADVPLGVFLSGGIDSSSIAAVMSELADAPIKTFSVGFSEPGANELESARAVAEAFRTDHHEVVVTPEDFFAVLPHLTWHSDEPIAHPASVPLYFVAQLASRHVKAVLTGEGADETLAGYARYRTTLLNLAVGGGYERLTAPSLRRALSTRICSLPPGSRTAQRLSRTFLARQADIEHLYFDNYSVFGAAMQRDLLAPDLVERIGPNDPHADARRYFDAAPDADFLERILYADCKTYLHGLLMKQDQMSMAASLESRVPFLDHELVELTARLPRHLKLRRGTTTKYVLRQSMASVLPKAILSRPKMGFPVPIDAWFRGPYRSVVDEYVLGERAHARGLFNRDFVQRLVAEHRVGGRHGERVWALVSFELWARCFLDGETASR